MDGERKSTLRDAGWGEAPEELLSALTHHRRLLAHCREHLCLIDADYRCLAVSESLASSFGLNADESVGRSVLALFSGEVRERVRRNLEEAFGGRETKREGWFEFPNGERQYCRAVFLPVYGETGHVSSVLVSSENATPARLAEEALSRSEETARTLLDATTDIVLLLDADFTILAANRAAAKGLNRNLKDLIGRKITEFVSRESATNRVAEVRRIVASGRPGFFEDQRNNRHFVHHIFPIMEQGRPTRMAAYIRDVTERLNTEKRLRERTRELGARVKELSCLYEISRVVEQYGDRFEEIMAKVVDVLPGGWQYSDLACAAIWLDRGGQYQSKDFREPVWRMTEPIMVNGAEAGRVMVGYMGDDWDGPGDQAPFLAEERALLRMIAERLGHIVSRFQTLRELKDSEERARALLNATDDVVALIEQDGSIVTVNDKFVERFGHDAQHYVGRNAFDLFPPDIAAERIQRLNQVFETGRSLSFEDQRGPHHLENALYPIFDSSGRVVMTAVYARDVTDRAKARERVQSYQDQLRSLAAQLSVAEEKERRQIAMDMHDGVGQLLAVAQIRAARLLAKTQTPAEAEELQGLVKLLEQASTETRNLTCQLHPTSLSKLGLGAALDEYLEIIGREHGLETRMHDDFKDKPLAPDAQVAAFRLTRELLINVVKHAQASTIDLYYQRVDNAVRITVSDNGVGFQPVDPPDVFLSRSFGLASVRERLTNLRGRLEVDSAPGRGSNVTLVVPLSDS